MINTENRIEIRYDEVDKMGYVYHGNYAKYYHISRTSLLKRVGICDRELEKQNIILPIIELNIRYLKPVFYGDIITVRTSLKEIQKIRIHFSHKVFNQDNEVINEADSTLVFVDSPSRKPMRIPETVLNKLKLLLKI